MLRVGPESAGATPGPICYGRGGTRPTITDANLALGRLDPERLLSVDHPVSIDGLRAAIEAAVGTPLGLDATAAAAAIVRVANDKMAGAVRMVSLARGHDPRDFALFAFGGAGPLHAVALARELGIPTVLIPARPGLTNALGCVVADLRHDFVATVNQPLEALDEARIGAVFHAQIVAGRERIAREQVAVERIVSVHRADMQFQGQSHILPVAVADINITVKELRAAFEAAYWQRFGVELSEIRPVLVNLHTAVIGQRKPLSLALIAAGEPAATLDEARRTTRPVWFDGGWVETPVYLRDRLPRDARFDGPAIVEQLDCTTVVEPGNRVWIDSIGNSGHHGVMGSSLAPSGRCFCLCEAAPDFARRPGNFHLLAQMKVTKAKGLNTHLCRSAWLHTCRGFGEAPQSIGSFPRRPFVASRLHRPEGAVGGLATFNRSARSTRSAWNALDRKRSQSTAANSSRQKSDAATRRASQEETVRTARSR